LSWATTTAAFAGSPAGIPRVVRLAQSGRPAGPRCPIPAAGDQNLAWAINFQGSLRDRWPAGLFLFTEVSQTQCTPPAPTPAITSQCGAGADIGAGAGQLPDQAERSGRPPSPTTTIRERRAQGLLSFPAVLRSFGRARPTPTSPASTTNHRRSPITCPSEPQWCSGADRECAEAVPGKVYWPMRGLRAGDVSAGRGGGPPPPPATPRPFPVSPSAGSWCRRSSRRDAAAHSGTPPSGWGTPACLVQDRRSAGGAPLRRRPEIFEAPAGRWAVPQRPPDRPSPWSFYAELGRGPTTSGLAYVPQGLRRHRDRRPWRFTARGPTAGGRSWPVTPRAAPFRRWPRGDSPPATSPISGASYAT